jgi:hypothetical protein
MTAEDRRKACVEFTKQAHAGGASFVVTHGGDRVRYAKGRLTYWVDGLGYRVLAGADYETAVDVTDLYDTRRAYS